MKWLIVCAVFLTVVAAAAALDGTVYKASLAHYKRQRGLKSNGEDDSISVARCENYYQIGNCSCTPRKNCDGALLQSDKDGLKCVASNKAGRSFGVDSFAHCVRLVVNVESETTTDPVAGCPDEYKILSCSLHSYRQHEHPTCRAVIKSGKCVVSGKGCGEGSCTKCRMQARCIRNGNWFDGQEQLRRR